MRQPLPLIIGSLILVGCQMSANAQVLLPSGYGDIRFGEKLIVVEARLKEKASPEKREFACDFVKFKKYPGLSFMVEDGIVTRADAAPEVKNVAGVAVGASMASVKKRFPHVRIDPHKYDEEGHYLVLPTPDGKAALLFEEGGGMVTDVRAGLEPSVEYVEGCS
jgi:hypothetical protein